MDWTDIIIEINSKDTEIASAIAQMVINRGIYIEDYSDFDEEIKMILTMMMSECCKEFEKLPIIEHVEILRNILYSGVWYRYEAVRQKREHKKSEGQDSKNA